MHQYEKFARILNTAIEQTGLHKNEMIRVLEIDRSTYFQILKGSRLPTQSQYRQLKKLLLLPKEESTQLDHMYYRSAMGEDVWENILQVRDFIAFLSETASLSNSSGLTEEDSVLERKMEENRICFLSGKEEVRSGITMILNELLHTDRLDCFLPASAKLFHEQLKHMMEGGRTDFYIRQLTGLPGGRVRDSQKAADIFRSVLMVLAVPSNTRLDCRYYYNSVSMISDIGQAFPWYVLCGDKVLLIAPDFESAVYAEDCELAKGYRHRFHQAFAEGEPLLKNFGSLDQNLQAVRSFLKGKIEVNYEAIPCTAMIATPEMIRKYVIPEAQEKLIEHCKALQDKETMIDIASLSGLKNFLKKRRIPEIPSEYMQEMETEDLVWYMDQVLSRLGKTLFLIDESRINAALDWDITIISEYSVLIHRHNYDTMILDEKNIVDIFTSFAAHILETPFIMDEEKAHRELLELKTQLTQGSL